MTRVSSFHGLSTRRTRCTRRTDPRFSEARVLRVAIEAQITQGVQGGLEQYLMALAAGLRDEARGEWAYTVLASNEDRDWMRPFVGPDHDIVARPVDAASPAEGLKKWLGPARGPAGRIWRRTLKLAGQEAPEREQPPIVVSDGFIERLGADVVHFPYIAHYEQTTRSGRADRSRSAAPSFPGVLFEEPPGLARSRVSGGDGARDDCRRRLRLRARRHRPAVRRAGGQGRDDSTRVVARCPPAPVA